MDVVRSTGLSQSTVSTILAKNEKYLEAWRKGAIDAKAVKVPKCQKLDEFLKSVNICFLR